MQEEQFFEIESKEGGVFLDGSRLSRKKELHALQVTKALSGVFLREGKTKGFTRSQDLLPRTR